MRPYPRLDPIGQFGLDKLPGELVLPGPHYLFPKFADESNDLVNNKESFEQFCLSLHALLGKILIDDS